jgi:hypothetical protein
VTRRCTECGNALEDKRAITCSASCRSKRHRRLRKREPSGRSVEQLTHDEVERAAQETLKEEIAPVIRESLTDEVLDALRDLVQLVPEAVQALRDDLSDTNDKDRRQRAYTQLLRYTAGHGALVPDQTDQTRTVEVVLNGIPHAQSTGPVSAAPAPNGHGVRTRQCDMCKTDYPDVPDNFVGQSDRCWNCFNGLKNSVAQIEERTGGG